LADHTLSTVLDRLAFPECPRWHDGRLWFADFYTHRVVSAAADGSDVRVEAEVPQQPSGLGWLRTVPMETSESLSPISCALILSSCSGFTTRSTTAP